jgi:hypothetical protein
MRSFLPPLLTVIDLDSAALSGTATVLHPLSSVGTWRLTVHQAEDQPLAIVDLIVREDASAKRASLDLDAAARTAPTRQAGEPAASHTLRPGAYVQLHGAEVGLFAMLRQPDTSRIVWDSRNLQPGDLFGFLPLRPGRYSLSNTLSAASCPVTVTYPDPRTNQGSPRHRHDSVWLRARQPGGFDPPTLTVASAQAILVEPMAPSRFTFQLQEPDDGPVDLPRWRAEFDRRLFQRWRSPRHAAE